MWLHPPKNIELNMHDELFVLSDKSQSQTQEDFGRQFIDSSKLLKNEEKKTQENNVNMMKHLNTELQEMLQSAKEWEHDLEAS